VDVAVLSAASGVPWFPESLREPMAGAERSVASLAYVLVEEIVDGTVVLMRWPWPLADPYGRLFWPDADEQRSAAAAVDVHLLQHQLYGPNQLERSPRCGDAFAARPGRGWGRRGRITDVRALFDGPVLDISADAREAAKLAFEGGVASVRPGDAGGGTVWAVLRDAQSERLQRRAAVLQPAPPPPRQSRADR
jgi:hypothetical protein